MSTQKELGFQINRLKVLQAIVAVESILPVVSDYFEIQCDEISEMGNTQCREFLHFLSRFLAALPRPRTRKLDDRNHQHGEQHHE